MALVKNDFKRKLKKHVISQNDKIQENFDKAVDNFSEKLEQLLDERIKSITITIPSGAITVLAAGSPASNPQPIILDNVIK
jgi:hypothetical protein